MKGNFVIVIYKNIFDDHIYLIVEMMFRNDDTLFHDDKMSVTQLALPKIGFLNMRINYHM